MTTTRPICRRRHLSTTSEQRRQNAADTMSPEHLQQWLDQAMAALAIAQGEVDWLAELLQQRTTQIEAGTWSPPAAVESRWRPPLSDPPDTL